jgi:hypothetical protein
VRWLSLLAAAAAWRKRAVQAGAGDADNLGDPAGGHITALVELPGDGELAGLIDGPRAGSLPPCRALAAARPSRVRSVARSRSNSAIAART